MESNPLAVLVEDNLMFAMALEPALRQAGYRVKTLGGGAGLVDQVVAAAPALIVVNLTALRFSGPDLVRQAKAHPELEAAAILGYAGHVEREFFEAGREAGADMVVPNSALRQSLPEVLAKLGRLRAKKATPE